MNSTILGALIGLVGAGLGSLGSSLTTRRTLRAQRELAADQRLWERRAAVYEEILADATHRQLAREHEMRLFRYADDVEAKIRAPLDAYERPDPIVFEARVRAYASEAVIAAFSAANTADRAVWEADAEHKAAVAAARRNPLGQEAERVSSLGPATRARAQEANAVCVALIEAVRAELHGPATRPRRTLLPRARMWRAARRQSAVSSAGSSTLT